MRVHGGKKHTHPALLDTCIDATLLLMHDLAVHHSRRVQGNAGLRQHQQLLVEGVLQACREQVDERLCEPELAPPSLRPCCDLPSVEDAVRGETRVVGWRVDVHGEQVLLVQDRGPGFRPAGLLQLGQSIGACLLGFATGRFQVVAGHQACRGSRLLQRLV